MLFRANSSAVMETQRAVCDQATNSVCTCIWVGLRDLVKKSRIRPQEERGLRTPRLAGVRKLGAEQLNPLSY